MLWDKQIRWAVEIQLMEFSVRILKFSTNIAHMVQSFFKLEII